MLFTNNIHLFTFLQLYLFVDLGFRKNMPDKEIAIILAGNLFCESKKKTLIDNIFHNSPNCNTTNNFFFKINTLYMEFYKNAPFFTLYYWV